MIEQVSNFYNRQILYLKSSTIAQSFWTIPKRKGIRSAIDCPHLF